MIRLGWAQPVNFAFSSAKAHGHSSLFTYKRTTVVYVAPKLTVGWRSIRAAATTATSICTTERLKREDYRHTNFDSAFSEWKILSGPSDWENYLMGKEGSERYRTQNLPNTGCPGLYEIAIVTSLVRPGRKSRKFSPSSVIVVYVGQSQNLRARVQQYGRNGAHLENRFLNNQNFITNSPSVFSSPGLFSDVFSKGHTIVYRDAPMKSKRDAEEIEDKLLRKFDYAWNKKRNGDRRPGDIHKKLETRARKSQFSLVNMICQYFHQIKTRGSFISKNQNNSATSLDRIRKLQPRQVGRGSNEHSTSICGGHGSSICTEHKGMKVDGHIKKFQREGKASDIIAGRHNQKSNKSIVTRKPYASEHPIKYEKICSYLWSYVRRWFS